MNTRAILLVALAAFLFAGIVHADEPILTGSEIKIADAISGANAVFVGRITKVGTETILPTTVMYNGTAYSGFGVKVLHVVRGFVGAQTSVTLIVDGKVREVMPAVGYSYIFFVVKNDGPSDQFFASKLLPATAGNIAMVKKLTSN